MSIELPDVRPSLTQRRVICGYKCYITVSFIEDDRKVEPAEVFMKIAKQGSVIAGLMDTITFLISVSLQSGVPWERIQKGLLHHKFEQGSDQEHTSLVDGLAKAVDALLIERRKVVLDTQENA